MCMIVCVFRHMHGCIGAYMYGCMCVYRMCVFGVEGGSVPSSLSFPFV